MPTAGRHLLPLALAGLFLLATAPGVAAVTIAYPTQSLGDRGVDVRAIQGLLTHRGLPVALDGVCGATASRPMGSSAARRGRS